MGAVPQDASPTRRLAAWRVGCWIVLLLAALGGVQYLRQHDYPYLVCALGVIVVCAGCILRQAWARQPMRVVAVVLAGWALVTGGLMLAHWGQFEQARQQAMAQTQLSDMLLAVIAQARRNYLMGLALKVLVVPLLAWLAWVLGQPGVSAQFRRRR